MSTVTTATDTTVMATDNAAPTTNTPATTTESRKSFSTPVFDAGAPFTVSIISGGKKTAKVNYPSDEQWCERSRRRRTVQKAIGRGKVVPVPQHNEAADAELFRAVVIETDSTFDDAEAADVILRLDDSMVINTTRVPDGFKIELKAGRFLTTHLMSMPLKSQTIEHARASVFPMDDNKLRVTRVALEPSGELYDKLIKASFGYSPAGVPINHKFTIVFELLDACEREVSDDGDLSPEMAPRE